MRRILISAGIAAMGMVIGVACGPGGGEPAGVPLLEMPEVSPTGPIPTSAAVTDIATPTVTRSTPETASQGAQAAGFAALLAKRSALLEPAPWLALAAIKDEYSPHTLWSLRAGDSTVQEANSEAVWTFAVEPQTSDGPPRVAYVTGNRTQGSLTGLALHMVRLPDGQIETITNLTSPETTFSGQDPNDENSNYWQISAIADAITFPGSVAWSPDGKWLAFVGAMDGPSADVYSYELATGQIRQLTSGADHAYQLLWSPDSRWIVHIAQEQFARSGGVYEAASGVWAAAPDGSEVKTLEGPRASEFLGWLDADTLVVEGGGRMGPGRDLRLITTSTAKVTNLEPPCYEGFAYSILHNEYLVDVGESTLSECPGMDGWRPGLFLVRDGTRTPIEGLDAFAYRWSDVWGVFFATQWGDEAAVTISTDGVILPDFASQIPSEDIVSTGSGDALAWTSDGNLIIAIGPDYQPVSISKTMFGTSGSMAWSR